MFTISIFLSLFFLIWAFFLSLLSDSFRRLGEHLSLDIFQSSKARFFYGTLHRLFFKNTEFDLSFTLSSTIARLGYAVSIFLAIFYALPLSLLEIWIFAIVSLILFLLVGDVFPRILSLRAPEKSFSFSQPFASFFLTLSFPISLFFLKLSEMLSLSAKKEKGLDHVEEMKETIFQILRTSNMKEKLNALDKKLLESVIEFKNRIVREVMVPRVDLFSLASDTPIRVAAKELVEEGYSRTPVYKESVDNIVGVLMFKDILQLYMDSSEGKKDPSLLDAPIETIAKPVFYTPETKKVSHLLQEFRAKQMHMAIVVDEYGGTEGVVTMEDILEEIVGDIADEYDLDEEKLYTTQPGGVGWIVDARMSILDAEDIFNIHVPQEGDYDTIGGYIFHKVGSIPEKGLKIHHEDFDLEILSSSERSVEKVRITPRRRENESS